MRNHTFEIFVRHSNAWHKRQTQRGRQFNSLMCQHWFHVQYLIYLHPKIVKIHKIIYQVFCALSRWYLRVLCMHSEIWKIWLEHVTCQETAPHLCQIRPLWRNITASMQMHTDTIIKKQRSLGILSYVCWLFYEGDKSNIAHEINVDTWGTWTGDLSEFGAYVRHCCGAQKSRKWDSAYSWKRL